MKIEITTYEKPVIVEGEIEKLQLLKSLTINGNLNKIQELTVPQKGISKSGIYTSIVSDILAYLDLSQTVTTSWIIKDKFSNLSKSEIQELLINRIDSVTTGVIHFPENLFIFKTIRIEYEQALIDVIEIRRKHWEYILYKAVNYSSEYYASIVFTKSAADWSKILKLSDDEVRIAQSKNNEEIDLMIIEKRKSNWS